MKSQRRTFRNIILPLLILAPLLWLMTGCFHLPWFEHRTDSGPNIRAVVGPANSNRAIRPGNITRAQVIALLGPPEYMSLDGTAIAYLTDTASAYWVWPLCFAAEPADSKSYMVRLIFDKDDRLKSYDWADSEYKYDWLNTYPTMETPPIMKLNKTDPTLMYVGPQAGDSSDPATTTKP